MATHGNNRQAGTVDAITTNPDPSHDSSRNKARRSGNTEPVKPNMKTDAKLYKQLKRWLDLPVNYELLVERHAEKNRELVDRGFDTDAIGALGSNLSLMALWWKSRWLAALYENDEKAELIGATYVDYIYYSTRLMILRHDRIDGYAFIVYPQLHLCYCTLLAFGRWEQAMWLGKRLHQGALRDLVEAEHEGHLELREITEDKLFSDEYWENSEWISTGCFVSLKDLPFCGFVLQLWLITCDLMEPEETFPEFPSCGPYTGLFVDWNNTETLKESINEACDYHLKRTKANDDDNEFDNEPHKVMPLELLAYRNARSRIGLETPWPEHPLLSSCFVKRLPRALPLSKDSHLLEMLAAARTVFPDL